jgi:farnesyl diphosphate synthase
MNYAVFGGGKRIRALLVAKSCALFGVADAAAWHVAAAVELLHSASLVLDDLPAMDNADRRRDGPSVHRRFGEAQAILASIGLIARSFAILSDPKASTDAEIRTQLIARCAEAIGPLGMAGGQALDLEGANGRPHKTADFIAFCCEAGPILGRSHSDLRQLMRRYGESLGHVFQNRDDVLDGLPADAVAESDAAHVLEARRTLAELETQYGYPAAATAPFLAFVEWAKGRSS